MKEGSVFSKVTGLFESATGADCSEADWLAIVAHIQSQGRDVAAGRYDHLSQRIDIALMEASRGDFSPAEDFVTDYQPPQPDADHEWRANVVNGRPRWVKKPEVAQREHKDRVARARLREIDLELVRPLVELRAGPSEKAEAKLAELAAEAAELRKDVIRTPEE